MARFNIKHFAALGAISLLSACGHTGGNLPAVAGAQSQGATRATLHVKVPSKKSTAASLRRPQYVSSATQSVSLRYTIGSTTYPVQIVNVASSSPNCTADQNYNLNCTVTFNAVPGNATFTVRAYDGADGTGKMLSTATSSMKILAGQNNTFNVTLDGVVGAFNVGFTTPSNDGATIPAATAADVPIVISARDPDGSTIVNSSQLLSADGSPLSAAALTITGDPAVFSLKQNGTTLTPTSGTTYSISAPFTGLALHYNGGLYQDVSVTVGAGSATGQAQLSVRPVVDEFAPTSGLKLLDGQLAVGPDGNVWFTERQYNGNGVGKVTPSGTISEYALQGSAVPYGITSASGNLWISEAGNCPSLCGIQEMATDGTIAARFDVYHGTCDPYPGALASDASGNVWYDNSACGAIGYLPAQQRSAEQHFDVGSTGKMTAGGDGNIWFVADDANYTFDVGKISPSGATQTYSIPQNGTGSRPESIAWRSSDKTLWVDHQAGSFDSVASASGALATYKNPFQSQSIIAAGNDGSIYAMAADGYGIVEFDSVAADGTTNRTWFYGTTSFVTMPSSFVAGPAGSNTFWFIDGNTGKIARISLGADTL